jgi:hypothetical protein
MKLLMLAVLLTIPQASPPAPAPTTDKTAPIQQGTQSPDNSSTPPASPPQPAPDTNTRKPDENSGATTKPDVSLAPVEISKWPPVSATKGWSDYTYWFFGLLLVVVGFLQVRLLAQTLGAINEQAGTMKVQAQTMEGQAQTMRDQTQALKDQAKIMDQQSKATEEAAKAATLNAKAAIENIEMFVSKERARLRAEPKDLSLDIQLGVAYVVGAIVSIYGPTSAFITKSGFSVEIVPSESVGRKEHVFLMPMLKLPKVISPFSEPIPIEQLVGVLIPGRENMTNEIKDGKLSVEIHGFIEYKDVFDRERVTRFRWVWRYLKSSEGKIYPGVGLWEKSGPVGDNKET